MHLPYAAIAEPRHTPRGGAHSAGRVRPRRPQRRAVQQVEIPERVYKGLHYSDVFVKAWAKMAALDVDTNKEHCNAHVTEMARFCGLSERDFQRALTEGRRPGPDGGEPEFTTQRMTRKSGIGRTAIRQVRPIADGERYVTVPVAMCEALEPRRLRAALLLAHTAKYTPGYQPTAAELGAELFHHHGDNAGKPLHPKTAGRIMRELGETGWATVGHRAGYQGRHAVTVHHTPLRPAPTPSTATGTDAPAEAEDGPVQLEFDLFGTAADTPADEPADAPLPEGPSADIHGGSAGHTGGGSLAIKEDSGVVTDESAMVVGGSRRRRSTGSKPAINAGDLAGGTFGSAASRAPRGTRPPTPPTTSTDRPPYDGPGLQLSPRVWRALTPVHHELPGIRPFLLRRIARAIGAQLNDGTDEERLAGRIERRYALMPREDIRDIGSWLIAVGIVHHGCNTPSCEDGWVWPTGEACEVCAHQRQVQTALWRQARELDDRLRQLRAQRQEQPALPPATPATGGGVAGVLPPKATYRQRSAASDEQVRAVIADHGPAAALHVYGPLRAGPVLRAEYGELAAAVGTEPPLPAPAPAAWRPGPMKETAPMSHDRTGYMPDQIRTQLGRTKDTGPLAVACPQPGCLAEEGQSCTTGRGRRRDPHDARTTAAAQTCGEETRS